MANMLLRMCPKTYETQWKLTQGTVPQSIMGLVEVLETIEESENAKRAQEKSKGSSDGKKKGSPMSFSMTAFPRNSLISPPRSASAVRSMEASP